MSIFWYVFSNKMSWLAWHGVMLRYLGESATVCTLGAIFPLVKGMSRAFALAFCSEQLPLLKCPGACAGFPIQNRLWCHQDIVWQNLHDIGNWDDDIYVSLEGYERMNARWAGDSKLDFIENRSIPPRYLSASHHWACLKFIQTEKSCV